MPKELDVLIGIVVIMTVASLLITVITQLISSVLALRGKNLAEALVAVFRHIEPAIDHPPTAATPPAGGAGATPPPPPEAANNTRLLACAILKHPTVSDSTLRMKGIFPECWKLATAIRPQECLDLIKHIAKPTVNIQHYLRRCSVAEAAIARDTAQKLLDKLSTSAQQQDAAAAFDAVKTIVAPGVSAETLDALETRLKLLAQRTAAGVDSLEQRWNKHFDVIEDRAEQWFTMHARFVTVITAFLLAFVLQLDTFRLYKTLARDSEARNSLVGLSQQVLMQAQTALADPAANVTAGDRVNSAENLVKEMKNVQTDNQVALVADPYPDGLCAWLGISPCFPYLTDSHLFGLLATAALLSLGSPFWFNMLKNLSSLRSSVADAIDEENDDQRKRAQTPANQQPQTGP
jgi:hypothetical protein